MSINAPFPFAARFSGHNISVEEYVCLDRIAAGSGTFADELARAVRDDVEGRMWAHRMIKVLRLKGLIAAGEDEVTGQKVYLATPQGRSLVN